MNRTARIILFASLLGAAALTAFLVWSRGRSVYTDASTIREPASGAPVRSILWQPPLPVPGPVNTPGEDYEPRLSPDGLTLFFVRGKAGANADILASTRTPEGWSEPSPLSAINSGADDLGPELSPDGRTLYFYSNRAGGLGGYDLYTSTLIDGAWSEPTNLGPAINTPFNEYSPALGPDSRTLYFSSNRPRPGEAPATAPDTWPATIRERFARHDYDLYTAPVPVPGAEDQTPAEPLLALNTPANEGTPALSPAGDFLYFSSDRPGGQGGLDLYRSRILRGDLQPPTNLGTPVNSEYDDLDPALSMGGFALHFSSSRPASLPGDTSVREPGPFDLYQSAAREVFRELEPRRAINWAGLWASVWRSLMWLLLSLLLFLALLRLIKEAGERKMGILTKCLLASLMVHMAIMFLLNLWGVAGSVGQALSSGGSTKVILSSAAPGIDSIAAQIRGPLADSSISRPEIQLATEVPSATPGLAAPEPAFRPADLAAAAAPPTPDVPIRLATPADSSLRAADALTPRPTVEPAVTPDIPLPARPAPASAAEASPAPATPGDRPLALAPPPTNESVRISTPDQTPGPAAPGPDATLHTAAARDSSPHAAPAVTGPSVPSLADAPAPESALALPSESARSAAGEAAPGPLAAARPAATPSAPAPSTSPSAPIQTPAPPSPAQPGSIAPLATISARDAAPAAASPPALAAPAPESDPAPLTSVSLPAEARAPAPTGSGAPERHATFAAAPTQPTSAPLPAPSLPHSGETAAGPPASLAASLAAAPLSLSSTPREADSRAPAAQPGLIPSAAGAPDALPAAALRLPTDTAPPAPSPDAPSSRAASAAGIDGLIAPSPAPSPSLAPSLRGAASPASPSPAPLDVSRLAPAAASTTSVSDAPARSALIPPPSAPSPSVTADPHTPALRLPTETAPPVSEYAQRAPEVRERILQRRGGSPETEKAVNLALAWLARHQSEDGRWSGEHFDDDCGGCSGPATADSDAAQTGLALLCFLGADHTHTKEGPYRDTVARGLAYLRSIQSEDGDLRDGETMYSHGIATIALSEAYGITRDPALKEHVASAARFIVAARNTKPGAGGGGWRYDPGQAGDTSVLGWQVMALTSARRAGIDIPDDAFQAARDFLDRVSGGGGGPGGRNGGGGGGGAAGGLYAYQRGQSPTPSMTAEGLFAQQLLGRGRDEPRMLASVEYLSDNLPSWPRRGRAADNRAASRQANTYYWYYATLALFQHGGDDWDRWNDALTAALLPAQRTDGPAAGSWDPADRWSRTGGRIYQTALCTLSLEVYYRYLPLYGPGE